MVAELLTSTADPVRTLLRDTDRASTSYRYDRARSDESRGELLRVSQRLSRRPRDSADEVVPGRRLRR